MKKFIPYVILFIIGAIFLGFNAFHNNLWFDESYSMAIIQHGFIDVWKLTSLDVHPPLYYLMLKIFTMIFGSGLVVARIFSIIGALLLASLGFTHLRKMFNDKVGFVFSFLAIFLPVVLSYAIEIRMYTWVAYFVALTAIYAYKFYLKNMGADASSPGGHKIRPYAIPLVIFTVLSAYTHYYGLLTVGVINLFLLIHAIRNKANQKLVITALIAEAVLYLPWFIFFLFAAMRVSNGFWIVIDYNTILNEIITFVFSAIYSNISMKYTIIIAYPIIFFTIYQMFKLKSKEMALCLKILAVVILIALATSYLRPIFIIRYLFPMIGLIIFMIAYAIASIKNKYIFASFLAAILLFSSYNFYFESQKMYNPLNDEVKTYIGSQLEEGDIIISARTRDLMGVASLMFPDNKCYFFNSDEWSIDICATYPNMERLTDLDMFEDYQGRIWVISGDDTNVYNLIDNSNKKMLEEPQYFVRPAFDNENFYVYLFEITKE